MAVPILQYAHLHDQQILSWSAPEVVMIYFKRFLS
jgi:hypothetical protein